MSENNSRPAGSPPAFKDTEGKLVLWGSDKENGPHVSGNLSVGEDRIRIFGYFGVSQKDGVPYLRLLKHSPSTPKGDLLGYGNPDTFPGGSCYEFKLNHGGQEILISAFPQRGLNEAQRAAIGVGTTPEPTPNDDRARTPSP